MENVMEKAEDGKLDEVRSINLTLSERGRALAKAVKDQVSYHDAMAHGKEIDRRLRWWQDFINPAVEAAHKSWKMVCDRRKEVAEPLEQAKYEISRACGLFEREQEEERKREEIRLQKKQEDDRLKEAAKLEKQGKKEEAEAVLDASLSPAPVTLPKMEKEQGTGKRTVWKFEIRNPDLIPREYLVPDYSKILAVAKALKDQANIPGVVVFSEVIKTFGGGR